MDLLAIRFKQVYEIHDFIGGEAVISRLHEMGLFRGQQIEFIGKTSKRGALVARVGTLLMALREEEAQCLKIAPL